MKITAAPSHRSGRPKKYDPAGWGNKNYMNARDQMIRTYHETAADRAGRYQPVDEKASNDKHRQNTVRHGRRAGETSDGRFASFTLSPQLLRATLARARIDNTVM